MSSIKRRMQKAAKRLSPCTHCPPEKQKACILNDEYNSCEAINIWEADRRQEERRKKFKCCGVPMLYKESYKIYICPVCGKEKRVV